MGKAVYLSAADGAMESLGHRDFLDVLLLNVLFAREAALPDVFLFISEEVGKDVLSPHSHLATYMRDRHVRVWNRKTVGSFVELHDAVAPPISIDPTQ